MALQFSAAVRNARLDAIETTLGVAPTQVSRARGAERARAARKSVPKTGTPAPGAERALFDALKALGKT